MVEDRRDHGTRDMALEARTLVNQHMIDCIGWRKSLETRLETIVADIKTVGNRQLLMIGGMIVIGKLLDWGTPLIKTMFHGQ